MSQDAGRRIRTAFSRTESGSVIQETNVDIEPSRVLRHVQPWWCEVSRTRLWVELEPAEGLPAVGRSNTGSRNPEKNGNDGAPYGGAEVAYPKLFSC